jgi:PAS domain S-box-containing protein
MNATLKIVSGKSFHCKDMSIHNDLAIKSTHSKMLFFEAKNSIQIDRKILQPEVLLSACSNTLLNSDNILNIDSPWISKNSILLEAEIMSEEFRLKLSVPEKSNFILNNEVETNAAGIKSALIQRKAEKELVDYQYALDQATIVAITDRAGVILYVNDNFCKISKYDKSELIGSDYRKFNTSNHPVSYIRNLWDTISNGKIWRGEFCNKAKDESKYWVCTTIIPFLDGNGKPYQYLAIHNDISEGKKSAENLRQTEIRLNETQSIAHISNWVIDLKANIHTWSDELFRIFGVDKDRRKPSIAYFQSFIHSEDRAIAKKIMHTAFKTASNSSLSFRFINKDGGIRFGYAWWEFEFNETGTPRRLYGVMQDITELTTSEANLKLLVGQIVEQKILGQKNIAKAILNAQENERNYLGEELHDNISQLLAGSKMFLGTAASKNETIKDIIKYPMELLDTSISEIRLLSSRLVSPQKSINLQQLISKLLSNINQNTSTKTSLSYIVSDGLISDDLKLNIYRIVQEQLHNISKYAEAENVCIIVKASRNSISITLTDDGKGFNLRKKRDGIGISNMKHRVASFNGKVVIKSSDGNGCKVRIKIPIKL